MELKKSPKADLQNKRGIFLEIGLLCSILFAVYMFSWSQREKVIEQFDLGVAKVEEEIVEITRQDQKPPEPVKQTIAVATDIIQIVKNETKISTDFDFSTEFNENTAVVAQVKVKEEKAAEEDTPFLIAEEMPKFQKGDLNTFRTWVQSRLKYPVIAQENGISGRVMVSFVIEKDGTLGRIQVLASPDKSLSDEAVRVITGSPKWTPGKQRNANVAVRYNLPVDFRLQN